MLVNLSKPMLEITEMKDGNAFSSVKLDRESRKYIHVRLRHISKKYDSNNELSIENTYYPLTKCSETFLNKTEFEQYYYQLNLETNYYCVEDPNVMLRGTRDS